MDIDNNKLKNFDETLFTVDTKKIFGIELVDLQHL